MHIKKIIFAIVVALCVAVAGIVYFVTDNSGGESDSTVFVEAASCEPDSSSSREQVETDADIYVYVCGCVKNPGVVSLNSDSRIYEAIELAGGFTENADTDAVNQAEFIKDGQKIYIPAIGESINSAEGSDSSGLVNINTAGILELTTLPGIGESRAQAIIAYRDSNGLFSDINEIMNISGIKQSAFDKIKSYITV